MPELRLVEVTSDAVLGFREAAAKVRVSAGLRAEAAALEACYGPNPYSDFLGKYGKRPDPSQAATMGRWMGGRVKASNGTMQPRRTAFERKAEKEANRQRRAAVQLELEIRRLATAVSGLAENTTAPDELLQYLCPQLDEPEIRAQLSRAVQWLNRFDQEWRRREEKRAQGNP